MSFKKKLNKYFSEFTLKIPNHTKNKNYLYADYIELVALFSNNNFVTSSDIQDRFIDEGIIRIKESENSSEIGSTRSAEMDKVEATIRNYFLVLEERSQLFKETYPFEYSNLKIKLKEDIKHQHKLYLMLLIASNLNIFKSFQSDLTSEFEIISFHVLKSFLSTEAKIKNFGKHSDYKGDAKTKINKLAEDLNIEIDDYEMSFISDRNNQERGLDIIGWIPFDDDCPSMLVILGQCACGKNWYGKQHDTTRYENYLKFYKTIPQHVLFIPYSLINYSESKFYDSDEVEKGRMVFERRRVLEYFENESLINKLDSIKLVDKCLSFEEDIV